MKCPRCGTVLRREGLGGLVGTGVVVTLECPACHYRMEENMPTQKKKPYLR